MLGGERVQRTPHAPASELNGVRYWLFISIKHGHLLTEHWRKHFVHTNICVLVINVCYFTSYFTAEFIRRHDGSTKVKLNHLATWWLAAVQVISPASSMLVDGTKLKSPVEYILLKYGVCHVSLFWCMLNAAIATVQTQATIYVICRRWPRLDAGYFGFISG